MKLPSPRYRRLRGDLIEVYKYTHCLYKVREGLLEFETRTNTRGRSYELKKTTVQLIHATFLLASCHRHVEQPP
jgi:hypothetical protein